MKVRASTRKLFPIGSYAWGNWFREDGRFWTITLTMGIKGGQLLEIRQIELDQRTVNIGRF